MKKTYSDWNKITWPFSKLLIKYIEYVFHKIQFKKFYKFRLTLTCIIY